MEAARLLREAGWLGEQPTCPTAAVAPTCPDCPACFCANPELKEIAVVSATAAVVGLVGGVVASRWLNGCRRTRTAPARRGGGVVA